MSTATNQQQHETTHPAWCARVHPAGSLADESHQSATLTVEELEVHVTHDQSSDATADADLTI